MACAGGGLTLARLGRLTRSERTEAETRAQTQKGGGTGATWALKPMPTFSVTFSVK